MRVNGSNSVDTSRQSELTNGFFKKKLVTGGTHAEKLSFHPFSSSKRLYLFCVIKELILSHFNVTAVDPRRQNRLCSFKL